MPLTVCVYLRLNFSGGFGRTIISAYVRFGYSRSSRVIDLVPMRKRVCDFLLVRHSNLGSILHRFRDIAGFAIMTHPYSTLIFGAFPFHQMVHVEFRPSINVELISRVIILFFFRNIPTCDHGTWTLRTDRQTDGQMDRRHTVA